MTKIHINLFDIAYIRTRLSQYVTLKDALACILVNKSWFEDFIPTIWHTIDFEAHPQFVNLNMSVVTKHGRHIRIIENLNTIAALEAIQNASVSKLVSLSMVLDPCLHYQACCYDILRRNNASLKNISFSSLYEMEMYLFVDALSPSASTNASSRLSHLGLSGVTMTRDAFSSLLRMSPALVKLRISKTTLSPVSGAELYQHPKMVYLSASINQVFMVSNQSPGSPSLLAHFPNLKTWSAFNPTISDITPQVMKAEISQCCPLLNTMYSNLTPELFADLITDCFKNLKCICFMCDIISPTLTMAILAHIDTIDTILTYEPSPGFYESDDIHSVNKQLGQHGWAVQIMLQLCSRLKIVKIPLLEMNMGDIEKAEWSCTKLAFLYIRIHGLDTEEMVNRAIQLWVDGRNRKSQECNSHQLSAISQDNLPLEERVARHLLKFKELKEVWLGTYIRQVA
ncbi:hypothetical protein BGX27_000200 [Mortierella sp. AM989]|nr:hypothetical protein BGX27_000200 [Mortierella sp. AM989]